MKVKPLAVLFSLALCLSLVTAFASPHPNSVKANGVGPHTWHVMTNGSDTLGNGTVGNPWQTIQHAIDNAYENDTIIVHPGTYEAGNVVYEYTNLTIQSSDGPMVTFINGSLADPPDGFEISQEGVVIDGFTITDCANGIWLGGQGSGDNCTIKNNIIEDNYDGIWVNSYIYGSIITNNTIQRNHGSVTSGIHICVNSHDNLIGNNTIENNNHGIWIAGYDNKIIGNDILSNTEPSGHSGIHITGEYATGNVIHLNNIVGNSAVLGSYGVFSDSAFVDATNNWWGDVGGPPLAGSGDWVSGGAVAYTPWLGAPLVLPASHYEHVVAHPQTQVVDVVDASDESDTIVSLRLHEGMETDIVIAKYQSQPFPAEDFPDTALGKYVDVFVSDPEAVDWPIHVEVSYTDAELAAAGVDENTLGLYYYQMVDPFFRCSDTGVDTQNNVIWANVSEDEGNNLLGTPFGAGGLQNTPPVANDQVVYGLQNQPKSITLTASDVDGDPLTYSIVTGPSHGTLSGSAPNLTYIPNAGYYGTDSFTFKANDGIADSNIATVSITVEVPALTPAISQWGIMGMTIVFAAALVWVGRRRFAAKAGS
ncbi:MAG: Ig-like domain-containing protein [Chloroflexi bacterium]|nr:Ig-like domain-containing protein [Chloroflexota bacterium]